MIPKIIHYSWISTDEKPEIVQRCMQTWREKLPDYEFVLWDARRIAEEINNSFVDEAIMVKKWAFAADYVRCFAVYKYGGIYLDTDVEVLKSFDEFLNYRMFIGEEGISFLSGTIQKIIRLTSHCFGAEAGHPYLRLCLHYYNNRRFILSMNWDLPDTMRYDQTILPIIQSLLMTPYGFKSQGYYYDKEQTLSEGIKVYPSWYFDAPRRLTMKNTFCIHHCVGSWRTLSPKNKKRKYGVFEVLLIYSLKLINIIPRLFGYELSYIRVKW